MGAPEVMRVSDGTASVLRVRTEATKGRYVVARETAIPDTTWSILRYHAPFRYPHAQMGSESPPPILNSTIPTIQEPTESPRRHLQSQNSTMRVQTSMSNRPHRP